MGQFHQEKVLFLVSSIFMVPSKADQTSLLYFHCFLSPNRESLQKYVCHLNLQPEGRKVELENQNPKQMLLWKKWIFLCGLVVSNAKERTDMKLEIVDMKQEIVDMKQVIADIKL